MGFGWEKIVTCTFQCGWLGHLGLGVQNKSGHVLWLWREVGSGQN